MKIKRLGNITYPDAQKIQENKFKKNLDIKQSGQKVENCLLICEHPHVFTLGKSGAENNLLIDTAFLEKINASFYKTNRGGDITYHGPGQIVGYLHFDIDNFNIGTKEFVNKIELLIIEMLNEFGIKTEQKKGASGIWKRSESPRERKICAIGLKISRGITMHGFALNVNTDMSYFNYINPCGHIGAGTTSMQQELNKLVDIEVVRNAIVQKFKQF